MRTGHYLPCAHCHAWVSMPYETPPSTVLCNSCAPRPSRLLARFLCVWQAIRARLRLTVAAVWVVLYVMAMMGMGLVMVLR